MRGAAVVGALSAALGAVAPLTVFRPCGRGPVALAPLAAMPCVRAGQLVAITLLVAAAAWALAIRPSRWRPALVAAAAAGAGCALVAVLAWPGVCGSPTMPCVIGTRPAAVAAAAFQLLLAAGAGLALWRAARAPDRP